MSNNYRNLVIAAGGSMRPGDTIERYLYGISVQTGIDIFSLWKAWRNNYASRQTERKLEKLAQKRIRKDVFVRIAWFKGWIDEIEKVDPVIPAQDIVTIREALVVMRRVASIRSRMVVALDEIESFEQADAADYAEEPGE